MDGRPDRRGRGGDRSPRRDWRARWVGRRKFLSQKRLRASNSRLRVIGNDAHGVNSKNNYEPKRAFLRQNSGSFLWVARLRESSRFPSSFATGRRTRPLPKLAGHSIFGEKSSLRRLAECELRWADFRHAVTELALLFNTSGRRDIRRRPGRCSPAVHPLQVLT